MKQYKTTIVMTQVNNSSVRVGINYSRARAVTSGCRYTSVKRDLNPLHTAPHTRAPTTRPPLYIVTDGNHYFTPFIDKP